MRVTLWKTNALVKSLLVFMLILWSLPCFSNTENSYIKPLPSLPVTLDPKLYSDAYSVLVGTQIYDRLFNFDELQNVKPNLAEKWEVSEGGRIWTIYLKKGVYFHDGSLLTATDVEFTFYRLLQAGSVKSKELSIIEGAEAYSKKFSKTVSGIKVLSPNLLRIELISPFPPFLAILTAVNTEILPKNFGGQTEESFFKHPIGTGPFEFESFEHDRRITLTANPNYFRGKPFLDRVIFEKSSEDNAVNGFNRGYYHDLEWYFGVDTRRLTTTYTMIKAPVPDVSFIGFNTRRSPLNNVHLRKAMVYSLDRQRLVEECFPGRKMAVGYVPPGVGGYNSETAYVPFDLNKAREEVKVSGLSQQAISKPLVILRPDNHLCAEKFKNIVENSYRKIGMNIAVKYVPLGELYKHYGPRDFELFNMIFSSDYPEALFLLNYFRSDHPDNYSGFKSRAFDDLVIKASRSEDRHERFNLYRKAQGILQEEAAVLPLFYDTYESVYQKYVRGVEISPYMTYSIPMKTIYFEKDAQTSK